MGYADGAVRRRAAGREPRASGTPAETFTSKTMRRCLFQRCLAPVLAPVACRRPPPAPPDHHCAGFLRSGAPEPACRTQTGRPGSRICRACAVRRGKNGVPPANRTTWSPSGPIKHGRIGALDVEVSWHCLRRRLRVPSLRPAHTTLSLTLRHHGAACGVASASRPDSLPPPPCSRR